MRSFFIKQSQSHFFLVFIILYLISLCYFLFLFLFFLSLQVVHAHAHYALRARELNIIVIILHTPNVKILPLTIYNDIYTWQNKQIPNYWQKNTLAHDIRTQRIHHIRMYAHIYTQQQQSRIFFFFFSPEIFSSPKNFFQFLQIFFLAKKRVCTIHFCRPYSPLPLPFLACEKP